MKKRYVEFWVNRWGGFVETEQNPCGCHPFDFLITYGDKRFTRVFTSRRDFKRYANSLGLEKLK